MAKQKAPRIAKSALKSTHVANMQDYVLGLMGVLPDPDIVMRKAGKGQSHLRDLLVDSHLASVWDVRLSSVTKYPYEVDMEGVSSEVANFVAAHFDKWDVLGIAEQVLGAVAYGVQPFELLWYEDNGRWYIADVVAKYPEWFAWSIRHEAWMLWKRWMQVVLPAGRFVFESRRASYGNPYGDKLFSKVFWPVTLKRAGLQWWAKWVEKFGSPYLIGKYGVNTSKPEQDQILASLVEMIGSSVGIMNEDTQVEVIDPAGRAGSTQAHKDFVEVLNAEISKAVLGQTLTTELSGNSGSKAAAVVHDQVRDDIAQSDIRRVEQFFTKIIAWLVQVNFGKVASPTFKYEVPASLHVARVARDVQIFGIDSGRRPSLAYYRDLGFKDEWLEVADSPTPPRKAGLAQASVAMVLQDTSKEDEPVNSTKRIDKKFTRKVFGLIEAFAKMRERKAQRSLDALVEAYKGAIAEASSFDEAMELVASVASEKDIGTLAHEVAQIRWVASNVGGANG